MPRINGLNLSYDSSNDRGVISFTIVWDAADGPVGTLWDMIIEFIGVDAGEPGLGSDDLLGRFGFITRVLSTPNDSRRMPFTGSLDEDDPLFLPWPFGGDPVGIDEVRVDVSLLPVPRSSGARARSNVIRGLF